MSTYPTLQDKLADPAKAIETLEAINRELQQALNDSITRESDLRDAINHAVAAMDMACHASVMMARGSTSTGKMPTHAHIQNLLALALANIRNTTGMELGPPA
jgi:hypothetical protein